MKRLLLVAGAIAAALVLVGTIVAAAGAPRLREPNTVTVIEHADTDVVVDTGKAGDSTGDLLTFHNQLYDETDSRVVGRDQGSCVRISPRGGTWQCSWTSFLRGGQINVEGPFYDTTPSSVLAVNGGTGVYRNVRGTMELFVRSSGTKFEFVFHLIP
jgi:allene oxide cyclase